MAVFDDTERFLKGVNAKDPEAWKELYRRYYAPLCNYVWSILGNRDEAQDVVQESLISVWHSEAVFTRTVQLQAFLYRTVHHNHLKHLRDRDVYHHHLQRWHDMGDEVQDEHLYRMVEEEMVSHLRMSLSRLSQRQREVLELSMEGNSIEGIAEQLHISINTVKTFKKRAYLLLKKMYQNE